MPNTSPEPPRKVALFSGLGYGARCSGVQWLRSAAPRLYTLLIV
jgi:hypothetical protein